MVNQWYQDACWPRISDDVAKTMSKVCGFFHFIPHDKVQATLQAILDVVNQQISTTTDPIRLAMTAQLQLVGTHPFVDGNGRDSRWIEDYVLYRAGLPPVYIPNMDHDLSTPMELYVQQGYSGAEQGLQIIDNCLSQYEKACSGQKDFVQLSKLQESACGTLAP
jgi:Fic family protein